MENMEINLDSFRGILLESRRLNEKLYIGPRFWFDNLLTRLRGEEAPSCLYDRILDFFPREASSVVLKSEETCFVRYDCETEQYYQSIWNVKLRKFEEGRVLNYSLALEIASPKVINFGLDHRPIEAASSLVAALLSFKTSKGVVVLGEMGGDSFNKYMPLIEYSPVHAKIA